MASTTTLVSKPWPTQSDLIPTHCNALDFNSAFVPHKSLFNIYNYHTRTCAHIRNILTAFSLSLYKTVYDSYTVFQWISNSWSSVQKYLETNNAGLSNTVNTFTRSQIWGVIIDPSRIKFQLSRNVLRWNNNKFDPLYFKNKKNTHFQIPKSLNSFSSIKFGQCVTIKNKIFFRKARSHQRSQHQGHKVISVKVFWSAWY